MPLKISSSSLPSSLSARKQRRKRSRTEKATLALCFPLSLPLSLSFTKVRYASLLPLFTSLLLLLPLSPRCKDRRRKGKSEPRVVDRPTTTLFERPPPPSFSSLFSIAIPAPFRAFFGCPSQLQELLRVLSSPSARLLSIKVLRGPVLHGWDAIEFHAGKKKRNVRSRAFFRRDARSMKKARCPFRLFPLRVFRLVLSAAEQETLTPTPSSPKNLTSASKRRKKGANFLRGFTRRPTPLVSSSTSNSSLPLPPKNAPARRPAPGAPSPRDDEGDDDNDDDDQG